MLREGLVLSGPSEKKNSRPSYPVPARIVCSMGQEGVVVWTVAQAQGRGDSASSIQIAMQSLWNIKVAVLVKPEHENRISHVSTSSVKTGIANTLGKQSWWLPSVHASCFLSSPGSTCFEWSQLFHIWNSELCKACSYSKSLPAPLGRQAKIIISIS